jgi:tetratricopeptide (TPR) repeat protein
MTRSLRVTTVASLLLVACLIGSIALLRRVDEIRTGATLQEVLYISSPATLKRLSLGYDGLMADLYWTRAVQYFGTKHSTGDPNVKLLAPLLEITTTLDPHLVVAYQFGANFLAPQPPDGAGMPQRAVQLEQFGIKNNPDDWHLYYNLGFIYYMELKDYSAAAEAFARGSRVPNAHPFLKILAAQMAQHAGETELARMLWVTTYQSSGELAIRGNAQAHLRALQVDHDVDELEREVAIYYDRTGRWPDAFSELESPGLRRGVPVDPLGHPYKLMPGGTVEVQDPDFLPFINKGLPAGYVAPKIPKLLPPS